MDLYLKSETLNLPIKYSLDTHTTTVKEEVQTGERAYITYTDEELDIISGITGEITPAIHLVKKVFAAMVVRGNG